MTFRAVREAADGSAALQTFCQLMFVCVCADNSCYPPIAAIRERRNDQAWQIAKVFHAIFNVCNHHADAHPILVLCGSKLAIVQGIQLLLTLVDLPIVAQLRYPIEVLYASNMHVHQILDNIASCWIMNWIKT